jgi:hypothetical protein
MQDNARVQRRDDANFAQKSREKFAKFPEIRHAPRTKTQCVHSASSSFAAHTFTTSLRVDRVSIAFRSEKERVQRRDHANFAPNSREKIAKSPKIFGAPRAQKLRELSQRGSTNRRTSLQLYRESVCVLMQDNARVQRRDDANFAQKIVKNRAKNLQNFRKSGTPRAQKLRALGQRALCILHNVAES